MAALLRILILEDRPADVELMLHELRRDGFALEWQRVDTEVDYIAALQAASGKDLDVILSDYNLPQFTALQALHLLQEHDLDIPFIVVTGSVSEAVAVECMKQGATDYLLKDRMARLGEAVKSALREKCLRDEKRQAEAALRESEARYRSLFEDSPIALSEEDFSGVKEFIDRLRESGVSDFKMYFEEHPEDVHHCVSLIKILDVNQENARVLRARDKEVLSQGLLKVFTAHSFNVFRSELVALASGRTRFRGETTYRVHTGDEVHAALSLAVAPGYEETWAKVFVSIIDITERVYAERELQRHAERLRTLRAIDGAILAAWSPEDTSRAALRHLQHLVPFQRAEVVVFDYEDEGQEATVLTARVEGETNVGAGTRLPLDAVGPLGQFEQGKIQVVADVSALATTSPEGDHSTPSGQVAPLSPMARTLYGEGIQSFVTAPLIAQGELIGLLNLGASTPNAFTPSHVDIVHEVANQIAVALRQARLREQVQRHVVELEQRVAQRTAELSTANAELARASRLKDEFLASMSHELRTPLNAILGMSEGLQDQVYGPLNERQLQSLRTVEESGRHLLSLINDILDVSKIEAGKVELEVLPISVKSICQASLGLVRQTAYKKQIRLSLKLDSAVTTVQADVRRLKQILVNLLSNAVKFTPEGGEVSLEVAGDADRELVHLVVQDTGVGISKEEMKRLFQPFVQLDSSLSREHGGTGLGLVLVRRLTELHGGSVSAESQVGKGSRFTISLPWRSTKEHGKAEGWQGGENAIPSSSIPQHAHTRAMILVAEDNEDNVTTFRDYLLGRGYRVLVGRNGREAVALAKEERPDLILMDIQMPGMDGLAATRRIRADVDPSTGIRTGLADVPIIALTALAMPGDCDRCLEAGANGYLSKPVNLKELVSVIEAQLSTRVKAQVD
jgi:signal transduction histidine kinase/DNA-binding response OmpR family regulator